MLKNECVHEDAVSQDDGHMYCPDCNEVFKDCEQFFLTTVVNWEEL